MIRISRQDPTRHMLLRRLRHVRSVLRGDADPHGMSSAEVTRQSAFAKLEHCAENLRGNIRQNPSTTLQRAPRVRFTSA